MEECDTRGSITPPLQHSTTPLLLSAVLLAGGESRRMGQDKARVQYESEPLWRRQVKLLRRISPLEILISARTDPIWRPADTQFVADTPPSCGPLSGLVAAMAIMRGTHLFALAVDMPLMTDIYIRRMWQLAEPGKGVLPFADSRPEPLAAIYPRECFPLLSKALGGSDFSVTKIAENIGNSGYLTLVKLLDNDQPLFRSMNTSADLVI